MLGLGSASYLTNLLLFRGNIGELAAWSLLPWLLVTVEWLVQPVITWRRQLLMICLATAFWLSHNLMIFLAWPVCLIYAGLRLTGDWSAWKRWGTIWMVSLGLSLWYWLPAVAEKSLVLIDQVNLVKEAYQHFPTWSQLWFDAQEFGFSFSGSIDSLNLGVGWMQGWALLI